MTVPPENANTPAAASSVALIEAAFPGPRGNAKREVLTQALLCFNELGIEASTIDDLRRCSGQSVGTIYHHFKNKEGVVAALFFTGLDEQSRAIAEAMGAADSTARMVEALIEAYLRWAETHPEMARFLLLAREAVAKGPSAETLVERLRVRYQALDERLALARQQGDIQPLPDDLIPSLVLGPAESYCRAWLAGRRQTPPGVYAAALAAAAWRSIAL